MEKTFQTLEFYKIIEKLQAYSHTEYAKERFRNLEMYLSEDKVISALKETTEARKILDHVGNPSLVAMKDVDKLLNTANKGRYVNCIRTRIY